MPMHITPKSNGAGACGGDSESMDIQLDDVRHGVTDTERIVSAMKGNTIMPTLARKLVIKPGNRVLLLDAPDGYAALLGGLPEGARLVDEAPAEVVHAFVDRSADLTARASAAMRALAPGGVLWISYPKMATGTSDLSREVVWGAIDGWRPVTQVSVDNTWSAMRLRPASEVKSPRRQT